MAEAAKETRKKAECRWLTTDELLEIFTKPEIHQRLFISQREERPTNGALFAVHRQSLPVFKNDGYLWAKESHGNRMVGSVKKFKCLYACNKAEKNLKRHIYQMIEGEHGDTVLFHYRKDQKNQENRRRGAEIVQGTEKVNQLSLARQGGKLYCDSEFENQSTPQETKNDSFTNLPYPAAPGSPSALPRLMKYMEPSSEKNEKNLKRPIEIPGQHPAKSCGQEQQDHKSFQQNTELQKDRNNCKCSKKQHIVAITCCPPGAVHHNIQGSAASGGGVSFKKVFENDLPPKPGIPVRPCELPEPIKNGEQFLELIFPPVDHAVYFGDTTDGSLSKRFTNMLSPSRPDSNMDKISLKKELHFWLQKTPEGENGVAVLDEGGAGMIHLAAGLGYDWVIEALIVGAKIDINFSDKNGCTALHWAAYCGRKNTVEFLISKRAAHALPSFPPGSGENTPANLAYVAGHREIGDYLEKIVEHSLTTLEFHFDECIV